MIKTPAAGPVTYGIDVSHYQGRIDYSHLKASGVEFVIAKATEYSIDDTFLANKTGAHAAGVLFGAYDFFHPSRDPVMQANMFLHTAALKKGDLYPMLDWETTDGVPSAQDRAHGRAWLDTVEKALGVPPMIYGGPYFLQALGLDAAFARYPLVLAHYGTMSPLVPAPWKTWAIHQYTDKGVIPGVHARTDMDRFNGSRADMARIII